MELKGKHVGLVVTGSFHTFAKIEQEIKHLKETGAILYPVFSESIQSASSHFGDTDQFVDRITSITEMKPILKVEETEPIGPKGYLDVLLVAPYTGNTLAKLASGITNTPAPMATKTHLRNGGPLMISVSANDALSISLKNIDLLFNIKNTYFAPFGQNDPMKKSTSMIAHTGLIEGTLREALKGRQIQPAIQGL